jgi:hypothetical protein
MITADYLGKPGRYDCNDSVEIGALGEGCLTVPFGVAGGCLDAPVTICSGSVFWYEYISPNLIGKGTWMPSTVVRGA